MEANLKELFEELNNTNIDELEKYDKKLQELLDDIEKLQIGSDNNE